MSVTSKNGSVANSNKLECDRIDEIDAKLSDIWKKSRATVKPCYASLNSEPGDEYLMNHKRRGKCVIFNHRVFENKNLNERRGTELDAFALTKCFKYFGFEVKTYTDLTVGELTAMLKAYAKEDHTDADCFVCCVMTHGDQAHLWARNDKYAIDFLFNPFTADNCASLTGKPKMFFIQACRGDKLDPGVVLKIGTDEVDSAKYYSIPTWADFLIAYSTVPGYYSWRNTRDGSWFMQSLAELMCREATHTSFLDVITKVNHKVAYDYISQVPNDKEYDKQKQVPSTIHMLTRKLVLRLKDNDIPSNLVGAKETAKSGISTIMTSASATILSGESIEISRELAARVEPIKVGDGGDQKPSETSKDASNNNTNSANKDTQAKNSNHKSSDV